MFHSKIHIEVGDLVILYMARDNMVAINITPGEVFHNKFGMYKHDELVGVKYGSKVHSPPPHAGYIYVLRPTPELWTLSLPHRTQILYMPDIAYITMQLGVRVGGTVLEAGTGSGSMTHSLSRSVGPKGQVLSFEYHRIRFEKAGEEFVDHGLDNVKLEHRNVCKDGFGDASGVEGVFLDLPAPWEAIPAAVKTLRTDVITRICCFSPCLEQVLKTVAMLRTEGFAEVLVRNHDLVTAQNISASHMASVTSLVDRLKDHEKRKEDRRVVQMKTAREKARKMKEAADAAAEKEEIVEGNGMKRKFEDLDGMVVLEATEGTETNGTNGISEAKESNGSTEAAEARAVRPPRAPLHPLPTYHPDVPALWSEPTKDLASSLLTKPSAEMRGHTSYLTFACFHPESIRAQLAAQETKSRKVTPTPVPSRVAELVLQAGREGRESSLESDYGSDGIDQVMETLTEEELVAMTGL
ncbi:tRNA (adenine57-N1/adenine58-N1)-methyltransferase catalytic subunit, partial [Tremellales sp. Uapishka_1]